jgi:colanic acid biosynthesis glycosyl transferase WcaI
MEKPQALFVTQYYRPELVGSAPFVADLAEWFAQSGWEITVLTGLPNYPDGAIFPDYRGGNRRREKIDDVLIERLHIWVPRRRTALYRIASEAWFLIQGAGALATRRVQRHRLVISLCPSILAVLLGRLARLPGGRHIAVVHDIQSGLAESLNIVRASWLLRVMRWCERKILSRVDAIVVLTEEMKEYLRRIGVTAPVEVLPIWADTDRISCLSEDQGDCKRLVYSGSFGRKQKLEQIVALAGDLGERAPELGILLRGRGTEFEALRQKIAAKDLHNVGFCDLVPSERLFAAMSGSDIHLVVHDPSVADFAIPSKLYNIMAAGLPCVVQARGDTALMRLHHQSRGFLCLDSQDPRTLAGAVMQLANDATLRRMLGRNARRHIEVNCAKPLVLGRYVEVAERLIRAAAATERPSVLIFEPEAEGHSSEWLRHLIRYAQATSAGPVVWIVVAPSLYKALGRELRRVGGDRIRLLPLTQVEFRLCRNRSLSVSSFARWWIALRYASRVNACAIHFLALDLLSLPLALHLPLGRRSVSGILFRPSTHYRFLGPYEPSWREKLRDLRKAILYRVMLSNPSLSTVLSLDPYFPRYARRKYANGRKIRAVDDPVDGANDGGHGGARLAALVPPRRTVFLLFGYLTERKGTLKLLDALGVLSSDVAARSAFMLVGNVDPSIDGAVRDRLARLQATDSQLFCHLEDRWVATEELETLVRRADVILAPYQRFVGSSGVMLWAARLGKPILTQDYGVLNSLATDYGLGITADCTKPFLIAAAISRFVIQGPDAFIDRKSAQLFIAEHSPQRFAEAVVASFSP